MQNIWKGIAIMAVWGAVGACAYFAKEAVAQVAIGAVFATLFIAGN